MTEHYNPQNEYFDQYGNDTNTEVLVEEVPSSPEVSTEVNINPSYSEVQFVNENNLINAQEFFDNLSESERSGLEDIVDKQAEIVELLQSENLIEREAAELAVLGSAFAAAPTNESEAVNLSAWKRILSGASKGARVAAVAFALSLPLSVSGQSEEAVKEDPNVTKIVENLFGKSLKERLSKKRTVEKARYAQLEEERRALYNQLSNGSEIAPRTEEEKTLFQMLEAKRDRKLAEIEEQHVKFTKEMMNSDLKDPAVVAYMEKKEAWFKELRFTIIHNFEVEIKQAYDRRSHSTGEREIQRRINKIEQEQDQLLRNKVRRSNGTYYY